MTDWLIDYPWRIALLATVLAAIAIWFNAEEPQPPKLHAVQSEDWKLPVIMRQPGGKSIATINANRLWGGSGNASSSGATELNDPEWRISGITQAGDEKMLLITQNGKVLDPPLVVGDVLPGGAKILAIYDDHLCLLIDGKKRKLGIFQ